MIASDWNRGKIKKSFLTNMGDQSAPFVTSQRADFQNDVCRFHSSKKFFVLAKSSVACLGMNVSLH